MPGTQGAHNNGRIFLSFQEKKEAKKEQLRCITLASLGKPVRYKSVFLLTPYLLIDPDVFFNLP